MKKIKFCCRGKYFEFDENGLINRLDIKNFVNSGEWKIWGFLSHHWRNSPDITLKQAFLNPQILIGCLIVDIDHNTKRIWGGKYNGKLPRVTQAYLVN